jgi:hypothetical protein
MRKRRQKFDELPRGCGNIEYLGLRKGQHVTVRGIGRGIVCGEPPQGPGVTVCFANGEKLVGGEDIVEATEPS